MSILTSIPFLGKGMPICQLLRMKHTKHSPHCFCQRPLYRVYILLLLLGKKFKEVFPLFVKMSNQQYRSKRARVLYKLIGQNFKTLRGYKGVSIEEVALATNIPAYRLEWVEKNGARIGNNALIRLCDYFNTSIECMVHHDLSEEQ